MRWNLISIGIACLVIVTCVAVRLLVANQYEDHAACLDTDGKKCYGMGTTYCKDKQVQGFRCYDCDKNADLPTKTCIPVEENIKCKLPATPETMDCGDKYKGTCYSPPGMVDWGCNRDIVSIGTCDETNKNCTGTENM